MSNSLRAGHPGRRRQPQWLDQDAWEDDDSPAMLPIRRKRPPADSQGKKRRRERPQATDDHQPDD